MFTNITWANYLLVITLLCTVYYLVIGFWFYSHELQAFISGFRKPGISPEHAKTSHLPQDSRSPGVMQEVWPEALEPPNISGNQLNHTATKEEWITSEDKLAIAEAAQKARTKEEFFQTLQLLLQAHPGLKETTFRSTIQDLIMAETEKSSSFSLTPQDFYELWLAADNLIGAVLPEDSSPNE